MYIFKILLWSFFFHPLFLSLHVTHLGTKGILPVSNWNIYFSITLTVKNIIILTLCLKGILWGFKNSFQLSNQCYNVAIKSYRQNLIYFSVSPSVTQGLEYSMIGWLMWLKVNAN